MNVRILLTLDPYRFPFDKTRELVSQLHKNNRHYLVIVDPAVAYVDYSHLITAKRLMLS
jgi:alpha-glucosidase